MYRPTYLEVNLDKLKSNIKKIINYNKDYDYFFGVVKNNCYHHGIYLVRLMRELGINYFAVSSLEEALDVRKYDDETPILCLEPINVDYIFDAINNNVTVTISSLEEVNEIISLKYKDSLNVHLKVDSGMNRLGFKSNNDLKKAYDLLSECKNVIIEGVYTHFATDGIKDKFYDIQVNNFKEITSLIPLSKIPIVHVDRSYTSLIHNKHEFANGFRMGLSMYGYVPNCFKSEDLSLESILSLYTEVISVRKACKGEFVGYGAKYKVKKDTYIATLPIGYADGVTKDFEYVYINNNKCKIVAECMDLIMVIVDDNVKVGDKVEIFGKNQSAIYLAKKMNLIDHKFLNLFSNRVPIVYIDQKNKFEVKY